MITYIIYHRNNSKNVANHKSLFSKPPVDMCNLTLVLALLFLCLPHFSVSLLSPCSNFQLQSIYDPVRKPQKVVRHSQTWNVNVWSLQFRLQLLLGLYITNFQQPTLHLGLFQEFWFPSVSFQLFAITGCPSGSHSRMQTATGCLCGCLTVTKQ